MPFWDKFKPRKRNQRETHQSTLQEPQTPPPQRRAPIEEVPSRELLRLATTEAQQHVDQKYPHLSKFELINHIWRTLVVHIEDIALAQGLSQEEMNNWSKEFRLQLFSSSLTLERAEVVNRLLTDALTMVDGQPIVIVKVVEGRRKLISELTVENLFSSRDTLNGASELAVKFINIGISKIYHAFLKSVRSEHEKVQLHYWSVSLENKLKEYLKEKRISNFVLKAIEYDMEVLQILAESCSLIDGQTNTIIPFFKVDAVIQHVKRHISSEHSSRGTSSVASDGWM